MFQRILPFGIGIAAILSIAGCQRLESARPFEFYKASEMSMESLPDRDAIPASFGDLVGVTSSATHSVRAQAWFMRADKSIAIVWINSRNGALMNRISSVMVLFVVALLLRQIRDGMGKARM